LPCDADTINGFPGVPPHIADIKVIGIEIVHL
jgi:hypothetical protein